MYESAKNFREICFVTFTDMGHHFMAKVPCQNLGISVQGEK